MVLKDNRKKIIEKEKRQLRFTTYDLRQLIQNVKPKTLLFSQSFLHRITKQKRKIFETLEKI